MNRWADAAARCVISSRIRLARNVRRHPFPHLAAAPEREAVRQQIEQAAAAHPAFDGADVISVDRLPPLERALLEERRMISHRFAAQGSSRLIILPRQPRVSILVNEEDHLRIQAMLPGLALARAWRLAGRVAQSFEEMLDIARAGNDAYVTASPENAGTGLRASVMLFLPALMLLKQADRLLNRCVQAGCAVRGAHGEGSAAAGFMIQLSAQPATARAIRPTLTKLARVCAYIAAHEQQARRRLAARQNGKLRRRLAWAGAQLYSAQAIDLDTGIAIVGLCRLAAVLRVSVPHCRAGDFNVMESIERRIQPAHIRHEAMRVSPATIGDPAARDDDRIRAALMRALLCAA